VDNQKRQGSEGKKSSKRERGGRKRVEEKSHFKKSEVFNVNRYQNLLCFYTNADSIVNKRAELQVVIAQHAPDIICITEYAPKNSNIAESELQVEGYDMFLNSNAYKRGVLIYVKKLLQASPSEVTNLCDFDENIWCEINLAGSDRLLIGCIYRSPNSDMINNAKLVSCLRKVCSEKKYTHLLLCGDFNIPEINWIDETTPANTTHLAFTFMECLRDCFLYQHVRQPTHFRGDQQANVLDLILSNEESMISDVSYGAPLGKSHHVSLTFNFKCYIDKPKKLRKSFKYDKGNYTEMRSNISEYNWEDDFEGKSCEECWNMFQVRVQSEMDKHIPKVTVRAAKPGQPLWMNRNALTKVKKKTQAFKRYLQTREGVDYLQYARARNQARWECRKAEKDFERKIAMEAKQNPKAFFNYAKSKMKTKTSVSELERQDGSKVSEDSDKAEVLNDFFSSVFTREDMSNMPDFPDRFFNETLTELHITRDMVLKKLEQLKPSKSPGPDGLHPRVAKELAEVLSGPLATIMNKSMVEGAPQSWKDANVSPIFKKGDRKQPGNYRPVSLTSVICKAMESIIRQHVLEYLLGNNLLTDCQHGFTSGRSCSTQLLAVLDIWTSIIDKGGNVDNIYLDYAKAFDKVPHERLLKKLSGYGIQGQILSWIRSFLSNRRQRVVVNGEVSDWTEVMSGVPQGSVLGPVLFICYINDLPDVIHTMVQMFADDTKVFSRVENRDDQKLLQDDIDRLQIWAKKWQLSFNASKCKVMHIGSANHSFDYSMSSDSNPVVLDSVTIEKDLGVHVDSSLKFHKHVETQVNKANKILGMIRRSYCHLDSTTLVKLYISLVRPHLEYCNAVWYPRYSKEANLIEGVQRRATKLVPTLKHLDYVERLKALDLPSMYYRRDRGDMIECYKYLNGLYKLPDGLLEVDRNSFTRGHSFKLKKLRCSTGMRQHYFSMRVVNKWNGLSSKVVSSPSLNTFKNRIDAAWKEHIYSIKTLHPLPNA
jgi:hypothetical protein